MALSEIQSVEDICAHYLPAYRDLCGQARVLCDSKSTAKDSIPTHHLINLENSLIETRAALQELSAICQSALREESADEAQQAALNREIDNTIEYAYPYEILTLELTVAWTSTLLASRSIVALEVVALTSKGWAAVPKGLCKDSPGLPRLCVSTHKLSAKLAETIVERARYGLKINWDFSPPTKRAGSSDNQRKSKQSRSGKSRDKFPSMTRLSTEEYDQRLASISEWLIDLHKSAEVVMATWIL